MLQNESIPLWFVICEACYIGYHGHNVSVGLIDTLLDCVETAQLL